MRILSVNRGAGQPQVADPVVSTITIYMVNKAKNAFSVMDSPSQAVCKKYLSKQGSRKVPLPVRIRAGALPRIFGVPSLAGNFP